MMRFISRRRTCCKTGRSKCWFLMMKTVMSRIQPRPTGFAWVTMAKRCLDSWRHSSQRIQATYYFAAIIGLPQNLLSLIRPNLPDELIFPENDHWKTFFQAPNSAARLGALASEQMITGVPYAPFAPSGNARPSDVSVYSAATKDQFLFVGPPTPAWQLKFAQQFAAMAKAHGVKLVCLHMLPTEVNDETNTPVVREREFWPEALRAEVTMMGIPPAKLYSGINSADLPRLFYTVNHFNRNGQAYFTRLITPRLLEIYETQTAH